MMRIRDFWLRWRISFSWHSPTYGPPGKQRGAETVMLRSRCCAAPSASCARVTLLRAWATGVLVQTLLERRAEGDLAEAHEAIDWVVDLAAENRSAMLEIALLRLYTLLARARGDEPPPRPAGKLPSDGGIA